MIDNGTAGGPAGDLARDTWMADRSSQAPGYARLRRWFTRRARVTAAGLSARQIANVVSSIAPIVASGLVQARLLGVRTTGEISSQYPTLVVPAGYTFAIWGPIFLGCCAYAAYQALSGRRDDPLLRKVGWWTAASFAGNALWIAAFQAERFRLAEGIIAGILLSLAGAYAGLLRLDRPLTRAERWLVEAPLGLFFGWITVANVANAAQVLVAYHWSGWGLAETQWSVSLLLLGGLFASLVVTASQSRAYALAVVWALAGIITNQREAAPAVAATAAALIALIALLLPLAPALRRGVPWLPGKPNLA
jgi:hypothetical protein